MELIEVDRKSQILRKAQFGCLRHGHVVNVTRGCHFRCVYCYARGYPETPSEVQLYRNLPQKLARELDNPRRRSPVQWVVFNTASDCFQPHPRILDITYQTMKILLERNIGFSFLTKGWIPESFIRLLAAYPHLVTPRIGLVSLSSRYGELFEPGAATAAQRLENIDRLKKLGMEVEVRVDPIVPFYTDDSGSIEGLCAALAARGVSTVSLSYLHLRPAILVQLQRELPPTEFNVLRSCFQSQSWNLVGTSTRSKLIPFPLRQKGYRRFTALAEDFGIKTLVCSCKNPDMPAHHCSAAMRISKTEGDRTGSNRQLSLFCS